MTNNVTRKTQGQKAQKGSKGGNGKGNGVKTTPKPKPKMKPVFNVYPNKMVVQQSFTDEHGLVLTSKALEVPLCFEVVKPEDAAEYLRTYSRYLEQVISLVPSAFPLKGKAPNSKYYKELLKFGVKYGLIKEKSDDKQAEATDEGATA